MLQYTLPAKVARLETMSAAPRDRMDELAEIVGNEASVQSHQVGCYMPLDCTLDYEESKDLAPSIEPLPATLTAQVPVAMVDNRSESNC